MKEYERKFLLKQLPEGLTESKHIQQGYLMFDGNKHLRIRVINHKKAVLTYKTVNSAIDRDEYEYEIPLEHGIELMLSTNIKLQKKRYSFASGKNHVDIDIYPDGTAVVEIEYESELLNLPDYCGEEITGSRKYSNIEIAKNGSAWDNG